MTDEAADVLMITHARPHYTQRSLESLLNNSHDSTRIWVWHNGDNESVVDIVRAYESRLHRVHYSKENVGLAPALNWLFESAEGAYLGKVDDDCLVPAGWDLKLLGAHRAVPGFGVVACWHFQEEDYVPELARKKIQRFPGDIQILRNVWVGGSGFLVKRECVKAVGPVRADRGFSEYCIEISRRGWINGWLFPLVLQEHMDDPRSPHTGLGSSADLMAHLPLSARNNGVTNLEQWSAQLQRSALVVQKAPIDLAYWAAWRVKVRNLQSWLVRKITRRPQHW